MDQPPAGTVSAEEGRPRQVCLRDEHQNDDHRFLTAWIDDDGNLRIEGHDLGPGTAMVSHDGEYEWCRTIIAEHIPRLSQILGVEPGEDLLDRLANHWSGPRSYDLEALLRDRADEIPSRLWVG